MDPMPLAGMFCRSAESARTAPLFPLTWMRCSECGAVQVAEDISGAQLYEEYNYASSTVPGLVRHFIGFADTLASFYGRDSALTYLEIGCNDGVLLNQLPPGWKRLGVDPSDVSRRAGAAASWRLVNRPFTPEVVKEHGLEGTVDVMSGSNCLAHITDLREVFAGAALALKPGGHFWVEVHDLAATLAGGQWDTIYHEHKVEWSESALVRCVCALGFAHEATLRTPLHGGLLRVRFRRDPHATPIPGRAPEPEPGLRGIQHAYDRRSDTPAARRLARILDEGGGIIAAYGAAGRANVYLNQLPHLRFAYIVDESPLRCGKFIPQTSTPIVPPSGMIDHPPVACLVTAWNHRDDIVRKYPGHTWEWLTAFGEA
jgi:SAM-dependent methyltransferase